MYFSSVLGALALSAGITFAATLTQVSNYGGSATSKAEM